MRKHKPTQKSHKTFRFIGGSINTDRSSVYQNPQTSSMILQHNREVTQAINEKLSMIRDEKRIKNRSQRFVTAPEVKIVPSYIKAYEDGLSEGTTKRSYRPRNRVNTSSILERFKKKDDSIPSD